MSFMDAVRSGFSNYITIQGRASRSAYWWWALFVILGGIVLSIVDGAVFGTPFAGSGILESLFSLGTIMTLGGQAGGSCWSSCQ
jgi:uncharacterized membrane protein YhaH (DUF805 family)